MAKRNGITDWKFIITLLSLLLVGLTVFALNQKLSYKSSAAKDNACTTAEKGCKLNCARAGGTQNRRCLEEDANGNCLAEEPITQAECESDCEEEALQCMLQTQQQQQQQQGTEQQTQQQNNNSQQSGGNR